MAASSLISMVLHYLKKKCFLKWTDSLFHSRILSKEHNLDHSLFEQILLSVKLSQEAFWTSSAQTDPSD